MMSPPRMSLRLFCVVALVGLSLSVVCSAALANDGGISMGGSPGLLKGHPSVRMTDEVIRITVGAETVTVDCRFTFTNHGPACTVRMGFPDQGFGAYDPDEEGGEEVMKTPPKTTFTSFRSYVEGKPVAARLIRADKPGAYWHTKTVRFPAQGIVHIRDLYTQRISGGIVTTPKGEGSVKQVAYVLHTGASWHGSIGRTEVIVTFHDAKLTAPLKPVPLARVSRSHNARDLRAPLSSPGIVVWRGPCPPTVAGRTLRFVRENWHPKERDDIELTYAYTGFRAPNL